MLEMLLLERTSAVMQVSLCPVSVMGSVGGVNMERAVIASACVAGLADLSWSIAALAGAIVFLVIELGRT
jgi:hypothetical protein